MEQAVEKTTMGTYCARAQVLRTDSCATDSGSGMMGALKGVAKNLLVTVALLPTVTLSITVVPCLSCTRWLTARIAMALIVAVEDSMRLTYVKAHTGCEGKEKDR